MIPLLDLSKEKPPTETRRPSRGGRDLPQNMDYDAASPRCDASCEDGVHIFLQCPDAEQAWMALGLPTPHFINLIWDARVSDNLDDDI